MIIGCYWLMCVFLSTLSIDTYRQQISTVVMCIVVWWAIANGLGARMAHLTPYQIGVQFRVFSQFDI